MDVLFATASVLCVFFFKQKTAYELRISDWSSDVCSSDLYDVVPRPQLAQERMLHLAVGPQGRLARLDNALAGAGRFGLLPPDAARIQIGRASCRERVCQYV